jgi:hypothetical protein
MTDSGGKVAFGWDTEEFFRRFELHEQIGIGGNYPAARSMLISLKETGRIKTNIDTPLASRLCDGAQRRGQADQSTGCREGKHVDTGVAPRLSLMPLCFVLVNPQQEVDKTQYLPADSSLEREVYILSEVRPLVSERGWLAVV